MSSLAQDSRLWSDADDQIIAGDLTAALAYVTPAGGAVVTPVAPIGLRDREAGTVAFTTSLGFGRKPENGFRAPANKTLLLLGNGLMARRGRSRARARA